MVLIATEPATSEHRGRVGDLALYGLSAAFAAVTAATSTLLPHRAWGQVAFFGYSAAALLTLVLIRSATITLRAWLTAVTFVAVALAPLTMEAVQRADGRTDRAQDEVTVVEQAGARLLDTGSPYLGRPAIAALPADERLLGYTPYQPGMAVFGLPRALAGGAWWTDARIWFALVTVGALLAAFGQLGPLWRIRRLPAGGQQDPTAPANGMFPAAGVFPAGGLVRAAQAATVLPICALTLATGGDDLPVLALSILALALATRDRQVAAGIVIGIAGALKLFAWPVALVLLVYALRQRTAGRFAAGALGLPLLALVPALLVDRDAFIENVLRFPSGRGLLVSPAQSPLPGELIAAHLPGGRTVALVLLLLAGAAIGWWLLRRPPAGAGGPALVSAVGLTAAIMLTPTTRFGYLLYPLSFATLWLALRRSPWSRRPGWPVRWPCRRSGTDATARLP